MLPARNNRSYFNDVSRRPYPSGQFHLELGEGNGENPEVGVIHSVEGGHFVAHTIGERAGSDPCELRHPGRQRFDELVFEIGSSMSPRFWAWVADSIAHRPRRMHGALVAYDFDGNERTRRTFYDALIAEVRFPALDAASHQPARVVVKIAPERIEFDEKGGPEQITPMPHLSAQKSWLCSNFRFRIDGFGDAMWAVHKVDGFAVRQHIIDNPIGHERHVRKEVGQIDYPSFSFHVPESHAGGFLSYWKRFVGEGPRAADERCGLLEYLTPDMKTAMLAVRFTGLGVTGVSFDRHEATKHGFRSVKVDVYCEELSVRAWG